MLTRIVSVKVKMGFHLSGRRRSRSVFRGAWGRGGGREGRELTHDESQAWMFLPAVVPAL